MDRREFLKQSAIAATALSASPRTLFGASHEKQKTVAALDGGLVRNFASRLRGQALLPGDAGYEAGCQNWLGGIPKRPGLVVLPAGTEDIAAAVRLAREQGLALSVRGGGHTLNYTNDGGVLLNLTSLQKIAVDPAKRLLRVDAGLTGGAVDKATSAYGLAAVMGECPSVGLSGLALGGGLGRLMGQHGALCDNLVSAEVVTADGNTLRVSADENADLFWATRGGGGNFGIATSFEFRLHPVGQVLSGVLQYPISRTREVLQFFGRYMETAPDALDTAMEIGSGILSYVENRGPAITIHVTCGGELRAAERALQPLRAFGPPDSDTIRAVTYFEAQAMGNFSPAVFVRPKGYVPYARRGFLTRLTNDAVDRIVAALEKPPSAYWYLALDHYLHGAVLRVPEAEMAFSLRQPGFSYRAVAFEESRPPKSIVAWAKSVQSALEPFSGGRMYVNYLTEDQGEPGVRAGFGANYTRLAALKKKWDPTNFLHLNHNIKPAA